MTLDPQNATTARTRPAKPALSRVAIVRAALDLVDVTGVDAVSMRKVAARLDTAAASLYVYVEDRKDLLEAAYDLALADVPVGAGSPGDWRSELEHLVTDEIAALAAHDDIALVALTEAQVGVNSLVITERIFALLRAAGLPDESRIAAADLIDQYTASTAIEHAGWARNERVADDGVAADPAATSVQKALNRIEAAYAALAPKDFPEITAMRRLLTEPDPLHRHRWKLRALITGITS